MNLWVVIPTFNEKENIEDMIRAILSLDLPVELHILVVDDNSPDGTADIIRKIETEDNRVHLLSREHERGLGNACKAGMKMVVDQGAEAILIMDADFSHPPRYIPQLISAVRDYQLVIGSRYTRGGVIHYPLTRRLLSKLANGFVHLSLGLPVADATTGFRCFQTEALKQITYEDIFSHGYIFHVELTYRFFKKGFNIKEVPIEFEPRRAGKAKMSIEEVIGGVKSVLRIRKELG